MSRIQKYLNKRHVLFVSVIALIAFLASVTVHIPAGPASAAAPAHSVQNAPFTDAELVQLIIQAKGYHPMTPIHFHGRSRGVLSQPGPTLAARPSMALPGTKRFAFVLSFSQTQKAKQMVTDYAARGGLVVSGASAALCGALFIEGTPVASAIAAATCGIAMGWYWADIQDAMSKVPIQDTHKGKTADKNKKCFVIIVNSWASWQWLDFMSGKCPKGKTK